MRPPVEPPTSAPTEPPSIGGPAPITQPPPRPHVPRPAGAPIAGMTSGDPLAGGGDGDTAAQGAPAPTGVQAKPPTAAMLPVQGGAVAIPAGVEPVDVLPDRPTTRRRGRLRRRLRHLRRVREVLLRDLGGLVFDIHRFATPADRDREDGLIEAKLARLAAVDAEVRELEERLNEKRPTVLREPGIGGACPNCGELFGSEATFCWRCGLQVDAEGLTRIAALGAAPMQPRLSAPAPAPPAPPPAPPPPRRRPRAPPTRCRRRPARHPTRRRRSRSHPPRKRAADREPGSSRLTIRYPPARPEGLHDSR